MASTASRQLNSRTILLNQFLCNDESFSKSFIRQDAVISKIKSGKIYFQFDAETEVFWQSYLDTLTQPENANHNFFEVCTSGNIVDSAGIGARLIVQGLKTASSSLLWEYQVENRPMPQVDSLSIVADGRGDLVCVSKQPR